MKFRLLWRRLTISAPRMAISTALPWPLRCALIAVVLGFSGAIALWAFQFGVNIAGLDKGARTQLEQLQGEVDKLLDERDRALAAANTAGSLQLVDSATQEKLKAQIKQLESANRALREDLGFFEKLMPAERGESLAIRGLQLKPVSATQYKWQVLVIRPEKNVGNFSGKLDITLAGQLDGKPWSMALPGGAQTLQLIQYGRLDGLVNVPAHAVVQTITCKVFEGNTLRATRTVKL